MKRLAVSVMILALTVVAVPATDVCGADVVPTLVPAQAPVTVAPAPTTTLAQPAQSYRLEADVTMRNIPVDVSFSGASLVIFGSVNRVGPVAPDTRTLDVVAVIQGARSRLTVWRKSNVFGLWINRKSVEFEQAPKYYAVASTRPLERIATKSVLAENGIGIEDVPISTALGEAAGLKPAVLAEFRHAAIMIGVRERTYVRHDKGISFVGSSLFRGQLDLPASIPVGPLDVNVYLFRGGEMLTRYDTKVTLAREGFESFVYASAQQHGWLYGIASVALATCVGLLASYIVSLRSR
jgi:uncharacterized protein (TIGR02186 family)